ncbi:hypothetical protein STAFG_6585 [Streptomyces afghaniensis 772]|uniref:Uncharacterized protein n=1 Tax=Streptomyces afghaniensis 772 TaxID=1283301 RepID=S4NDJ6_9ACTN|nr:hypothetical protein STAFG_6585 [Streptomyces afghaniensis 772]
MSAQGGGPPRLRPLYAVRTRPPCDSTPYRNDGRRHRSVIKQRWVRPPGGCP